MLLEEITSSDEELISMARDIIKRNYDHKKFNHTVGCALRCKSGKVYLGINVYSLYGACAETVAISNAIMNGESEFDCIVAIGGDRSDIVYSPCGNCRQMLSDYSPNCNVIISTENGPKKIRAKNLIPFAYLTPMD
ncbi:deaminase [Paenibacillus swuensis]|uniref:Deaminase n=1 Tax=Paenibacillus swuensis TaxID=1178515 RepID=A0A172TEB4_9BACL|nr:cytidine deaminase [Paenibacillus swuensis]ANE45350.1 deaminase [Paenibacillus swuensis]